MRRILIAAALLVATGAHAEDRVSAIAKMAACRKVTPLKVGMTQDAVLKTCWGNPGRRYKATREGVTVEEWQWGWQTGYRYMLFQNGVAVEVGESQ